MRSEEWWLRAASNYSYTISLSISLQTNLYGSQILKSLVIHRIYNFAALYNLCAATFTPHS